MDKRNPGRPPGWQTVRGLVLPDELKWPPGSSREEVIAHLNRLVATGALGPEAEAFVRQTLGGLNAPPDEEV